MVLIEWCYSCFHVTFLRDVAKFIGKLGTRLRTSQLRGELHNQNTNIVPNFSANKVHNFEVQTLQTAAYSQLSRKQTPSGIEKSVH